MLAPCPAASALSGRHSPANSSSRLSFRLASRPPCPLPCPTIYRRARLHVSASPATIVRPTAAIPRPPPFSTARARDPRRPIATPHHYLRARPPRRPASLRSAVDISAERLGARVIDGRGPQAVGDWCALIVRWNSAARGNVQWRECALVRRYIRLELSGD